MLSASKLPGGVSFLSFNESFSTVYGGQNIHFNGADVEISLTNSTGSGFKSNLLYGDSFFSASIKLPDNHYTAGVVATFYTTNSDIFPGNHDELDFEFLGNIPGKQWVVQTNFFGNGSEQRGREERFNLWFDPTQDFHNYRILWNKNWTVFYVDNVPMRQVHRIDAMGGGLPFEADVVVQYDMGRFELGNRRRSIQGQLPICAFHGGLFRFRHRWQRMFQG
ncbi:hypothetical protein V6N11_037260 [Hibiscus sabdariffa]|uniref:GH16 domain-containing protein n=1 Tax=Hibiscus sabdariffa TaxID=183260 RepID=A0ABR2P1D0_9ROSI